MELKSVLARISKQVILDKLENDLKNQQKKYNYHKKISDGYLELASQTIQQIDEVRTNAN
jgi:hypothetical protein